MNLLFSHLDLLSVGVVIAATGILGSVVYFNNTKSTTSQTFLGFCLLTIFWGSLNYLSYNIHTPELAFWLLRVSIFAATWHAFLLFQLLYVFPQESFKFPNLYEKLLIPLVAVTALLNFTPLTFNHISEVSDNGRIIKIANGPGIILFSLVILGLIIVGIYVFLKKIRKGSLSPKQVKPITIGIILTFALILTFNFIFPAFLNNPSFIPLGALFIFPFIVGASYSIIKHGLMNVKVISTEILTFVLAIVILLEVITSASIGILVYRISLFILVVLLGVLLIKSVIKEVKQREQLEILSKQLEAANEQLKVLDKARAEFISIASHQLRTPPATLKWYLASILGGDYGKVPDELNGIIEKANRTNNSQISLIDDMLNASRIERGKMEFMFQPANVLEMAQLTVEQLEPMAKERGLQLTFKPQTGQPPQIMVDKEKVRQVMNNLIDNSLKYTKQGSVTASLNWTNDEIKFSVTDTGKGMDAEEQASAFEKYTRGKDSLKHSAGLGLGLYVAKVIIEQHKGKIWADSPGVGKGSTFIFTLPVKNDLTETTVLDLTKNQN